MAEFLNLALNIIPFVLQIIIARQVLFNIDYLLFFLSLDIFLPHVDLVIPQRLKTLLGLLVSFFFLLQFGLLQFGLHCLYIGYPLLASDWYLHGFLVEFAITEGVDCLLQFDLVAFLVGLVKEPELLDDFCDIDKRIILEHIFDLSLSSSHHLQL